MTPNMIDIIQKKKEGKALTKAETEWFVRGLSDNSIPDYQVTALAMAIWFNGMKESETAELTMAMAASGRMTDTDKLGEYSVDKHSTGGVGDKTTLIVAPIAAALGATVGKMSGRGLGHTGGTVDKLESIDGYRTSMSQEEFLAQVKKIGIAVIGQSEGYVPADKRLYALRDVTATVDSLPLIASSIMSKKIASGARSIVLDVKVGSGAFMKTPESAAELASLMIKTGKSCGRRMAAVLTDMDTPLGRCIGNRLEVYEAVSVLKNEQGCDDLKEVCITLSACMAALSMGIPHTEARKLAIHALENGQALSRFREWIAAQGGATDWIDDENARRYAPLTREIYAAEDGYIHAMKADEIGRAAMLLGAGRAKKDDMIDFDAGITLLKKTGDPVKKGEALAILHASDPYRFDDAGAECLRAYVTGEIPPEVKPLVYRIMT